MSLWGCGIREGKFPGKSDKSWGSKDDEDLVEKTEGNILGRRNCMCEVHECGKAQFGPSKARSTIVPRC